MKQLVEMHGGSVEALSDVPGLGSEFVVRLPLIVAGQEILQTASPPITRHAGLPRRILVADDNRDNAESLSTLLTITGHETRMAHDGVEAVEAAEQFRPDLILLDIGMPRMNGYDACRRIREQEWARSMVIVALTGWGQEEDRNRSKEAGFDHHMVKPVEYHALMKLLTESAEASSP